MLVSSQIRPFTFLAAVALLLAGCGSDQELTSFKVTPVKGKVSQGGQPMAGATVTFTLQGQPPQGYKGSGAVTDAQGNFEVVTGTQKGALAGTYSITVSKKVGADGKPISNDPDSGMDAGMMEAGGDVKDLVPATFQPVTLTITEGTPVPDVVIDVPNS